MKKILFTIALFVGFQSNYAQHGGGGYTGCAADALNELATCLNGHGINYHLIDGGGGLYLYALGSFPPGHMTSCLSHYNHDRDDCPEAPVIINNTGPVAFTKATR